MTLNAGTTSAARVRSTPATLASTRSWAPFFWSVKRARIWTKRASYWKGDFMKTLVPFPTIESDHPGSAVRLDPNNSFARMKLAVVHSRNGQLQQV